MDRQSLKWHAKALMAIIFFGTFTFFLVFFLGCAFTNWSFWEIIKYSFIESLKIGPPVSISAYAFVFAFVKIFNF